MIYINDKTDLVQYLRLHGVDEDFKQEYCRRIYIDQKNKLILKKHERMLKLIEIFNI